MKKKITIDLTEEEFKYLLNHVTFASFPKVSDEDDSNLEERLFTLFVVIYNKLEKQNDK